MIGEVREAHLHRQPEGGEARNHGSQKNYTSRAVRNPTLAVRLQCRENKLATTSQTDGDETRIARVHHRLSTTQGGAFATIAGPNQGSSKSFGLRSCDGLFQPSPHVRTLIFRSIPMELEASLTMA